jgi:DNA polymerase III alpha subunit
MEIAARTEFNFRETFGPIKEVVAAGARGIADSNSWGHIFFFKECQKQGFNPLLGIRFNVYSELEQTRDKGDEWIGYAKGAGGLSALYRLVEQSEAQFYYRPRLTYAQVQENSEAVCWLGAPWKYKPNFPYYTHIHPGNPGVPRLSPIAATSDNYYPRIEDEEVYRLMALRGGILRGEPMHLLGPERLIREYGWDAVDQSVQIWEDYQVDHFPIATNVNYPVDDPMAEIRAIVERKLIDRGLDQNDEYYHRMEHELELIEDKGFGHYFLVIADMCAFAKRKMLVGPARGSSAGSLVCWLLGITEVDPIPHHLIFERFIDVNRFDFPDIDIDFPDEYRDLVFDYLAEKYHPEHVARLGTIMRYKPKSALTDFSKVLGIPDWETQVVKDAIIERSGGDARLSFCLEDTLNLLDVGQELVKKYPQIALAGRIEMHARQTGQHAAGVVICNEPITNFCGKSRNGVAQIEKKGSELLNMLKIDALGLRTLTVLQDACDVAGIDYHDLYDTPLDDQEAFDVLNQEKYAGIFQFEGASLQGVVRQTGVENFNDIAAATALGRPGPLNSGATGEYIQRRSGSKSVSYIHPLLEELTAETFGVIIYQEQVMICTRRIGNFSWADTANIRKLMSNRQGDESFMRFETLFIDGAQDNGLSEKEARTIWNGFVTFGSWAFNKSHAVSYGLVSYWCCWMKAHHPGAFAVGCLRHTRDPEQALRLLRELSKEGLNYIPVDPQHSDLNWTLHDGKLLGGLLNVKGIGEKSARHILNCRINNITMPPGMMKKLENPQTPYDHLWPVTDQFRDVYENPRAHNIKSIPLQFCNDVQETGEETHHIVIGRLVRKSIRDLNEESSVLKRGGKILKENTMKMTFLIEDDTGMLLCSINRFKYKEMGKPIIESVSPGEYLVVRGKLLPGYARIFFVDRWHRVVSPRDFLHMSAKNPLGVKYESV